MSTLSAFPFIGEQSFATPGAFNSPLSIISANIAAINTDVGAISGVTISPPSGNTIQMPSDLSISGYLSVGKGVSIGTQAPSIAEPVALTIGVNSGISDYLYFNDTSNLRSDYLIGSHAGGTADGLNIFDVSGNTMIASFSKQSIRFYQQVVGPVFDVGGALSDTLNAATFGVGSDSAESRIQAAINAASLGSISRVYVPASMYPYSASSVSFIYSVQLVREGGDWSVHDVIAYGAYGNGINDDTAAIQAAINNAMSAITRPSSVAVPSGVYNYTALSITSAVLIKGTGAANSILQSTQSNAASILFNYVSPGVGLDANRWSPGLRDLAIWRQGLALDGTALGLGGGNGAFGFVANGVRFTGFGNHLSLRSNCYLAEFDRCQFDAALRHIRIAASSVNAGENMAFMNCVFANGQNLANGILWDADGFNGDFLGCSFDGLQLSIGNGTVHCTNCHFESLGAIANSHISMSGGYLDLIAPEIYVNSATFTPSAPIILSGGTAVVMAAVASSTTTVAALFSVGAGATLFEYGTKQVAKFTDIATGAGTIGLSANVASRNSMLGTFSQSGGSVFLAPTFGDRVGIGTTSPNAALDVRASGTGRNIMQFYNTVDGVGNSAQFRIGANGAAGSIFLEMFSSSFAGIGNQGWIYTVAANAPLVLGASGGGIITLRSGGTVEVAFPMLAASGTAIAPAYGYSSEFSLGWYRSGVSTLALSYGTLNLASQAVRLSMRTIAASALTASAANTNVAVNETVFTISASGASWAINSGGTTWIFNSDASAKNT